MGKFVKSASSLDLCVMLVIYLNTFIFTTAQDSTRREILLDLLNTTKYDSNIAPDFEQDHPTNVSVQIFIINIHSINEAMMEYSLDVFFRQSWLDPRLVYGNRSTLPWLELDAKLIDKVWVPDTYFANEKRASFHTVTVPNKLMHLYRNGTVLYSMRLSLTLSCHMRLEKFPMDKQKCPIIIASYAYTVENIVFHWHPSRPIIMFRLEMPQFDTSNDDVDYSKCSKEYGKTPVEGGEFACISAQLLLKRQVGYYIVQIFLPSVMIVVLSWVSFWVDIDAVPARISLGVLTVLTMTTQSSGTRLSLPMVSYVKAIDVWMATCMLFVFASLLEFAYVNVLSRRKHAIKKSEKIEEISLKNGEQKVSTASAHSTDFKRKARQVDKVSRFVCPISFLIFNSVYWLYYIYA
ncbi:hypothetical protein ACJMK2_032673 [Sinanodonta woodiana]|uniref:Uncharacterized protein n=1 Tax=Sinanodonta woodiana TaxID=1069815 RepID=A0ABD3X4C4_SINWO